MIKVAALTSGRHVPSSRFRVRQFIRPLTDHGVFVSEHYPIVSKYLPTPRWGRSAANRVKALTRLPGILAARSSDVAWLQREFVPRERSWERLAGRTRILDVDDAIWLTAPTSFSEDIAAECYGVIAGNQFIADHYRPFARRVWIVPTSVDTDLWRPGSPRRGARWTIGWTGTSSNLHYLLDLDEPLAEFLAHCERAELLVVADKGPQFRKVPRSKVRFVRWAPGIEIEAVQSMHVGLMPLPDTEWARGKCAFKMLLYMAAGIPVVASPVGVNARLLEMDTVGLAACSPMAWYEALTRFAEDETFASAAGAAGRRIVEEHYSVRRNVVVLADIFTQAAMQ